MADTTYSFGIEDASQGAAEALAGGLDNLRSKILEDTAALRQMQAALRDMQKGSVVNVAAFKGLESKITAQKQAIAGAQSAYISAGGNFERVKKPVNDLAQAFTSAGGPIGGLATKLSSLSRGGSLSLAVVGVTALVAAAVALVAALAAMVVATVAAGAALVAFGAKAANARRTERLELEGLTKSYRGLFGVWGMVGGNASQIQGSIDQVSDSVALSRDKVRGYAEQLTRLRVKGDNLTQALEAISIVASTQGEGQAQLFKSMMLQAAMTGGSVDKLAKDVKARLGGLAARQMLDLNVQFSKFRENVGRLFDDLNVEPLLKLINSVTSMFRQSTIEGKALKTLMTVLLQPFMSSLEGADTLATEFFQGMIIGSQRVAIKILDAALAIKKAFKKTFKDSDLLGSIDMVQIGIFTIAAALGVMAVFLGLTLVALTPVVGMLAFMAVSMIVARKAFEFLVEKLSAVKDFVTAPFESLKSVDWASIGTNVITGIVAGLAGGTGQVLSAVVKLGGSMIKAFKGSLKSSSPSKAFEMVADTGPQGVVRSFTRGKEAVTRAAHQLVDLPTSVPSLAGSPSSGTAGAAPLIPPSVPTSTTTNTTRSLTLHIDKVEVPAGASKEDARAIADEILAIVAQRLDAVAIGMGV